MVTLALPTDQIMQIKLDGLSRDGGRQSLLTSHSETFAL